MKKLLFPVTGLIFAFGVVSNAQAFTVTDRWTDDLNTITNYSQDNRLTTLTINEDYNENNLIPYPSHDGNAIVNKAGDPGCPSGEGVCWFDKIITLEGETGSWDFNFNVTNTTPWNWSDYHFEVYDSTFTNKLAIITAVPHTGPFTNMGTNPATAPYDTVELFAPNWHESGGTYLYGLTVNLNLLPQETTSFGIRQIATTTPEPTSILGVLAFGTLGLASTFKGKLK